MRGIYKIINFKNGRVYIGSSNNIYSRWRQHLYNLINNIHDNYKLQADFNKYGISDFGFTLIEMVKNEKELLNREQYWIDTIDVENNYNILSYASYEYVDRIKDSFDIINLVVAKKDRKDLIKNISICDHEKLNEIGHDNNALSKSWYNRASANTRKKLSNHLCNFQYNICNNGKDFYWTTFVSYQKNISAKGCIKRFVSLTDIPKIKCNSLAYLVNSFVNPFLKREINISNDMYALNILLNWIINSANISKPIDIYIPSSRMRKMLTDWLREA